MNKNSQKIYSDQLNEKAREDFEKNRIYAMLAYLIFFLPLIACPSSRFGRYHANQGLLVLLLGIVLYLVQWIPFIGGIIFFTGGVCLFVLMLMGIGNAAQGKMVPLPVIGGFTLLRL